MRSLIIVIPLTLMLACSPGAPGPDTEETAAQASPAVAALDAPALAELANSAFTGILDQEVQLVDGRWEGEPYMEGGTSRPAVGLVTDFILHGDLTGDGNDESVVLLWTSSGGSGTFDYLAAAARDAQTVSILGIAEIGDRVKVRSGRIDNGRIELDVVQAGPDDAHCCPSQMATRSWTLGPSGLIEGEAEITGSLSSAAMAGHEWVLTEIGPGEKAPTEPEVTLLWEENRIAGGSGCNRYFAEITDSEEMAGGLSIGPAGSTQMMCPEEVMAVEDRFLQQLAKVNSFSFLAGKLLLQWQDGEEYGAMLFAPREPQS